MSKNLTQKQVAFMHSRYHLQEKLGEGAMGVVYQAIDRLNGESVALKRVTQLPPQTATLRATGASAGVVRLALAREFQILAGLRHPNIISVLDYGFGLGHGTCLGSEMVAGLDSDSQPFFTMTYLANPQTLLEAAEGQSFATKIALLQQMLQALAYLHRRQVIHRDLKPANVLVQGDTARVLDFGLAETTDQPKMTGASGTPLYMAPELFDGEVCSRASDLFAVGIMATQMLTGTHPFAPFDFQFLDRVFDEDPNLAGMDERLQLLVMRLLAKRPERRIASADEVLASLQGILASSDNTHASNLSMPLETQAIRESYLQAATFVGRETEMTQLQCALAKAKEGAGSAWLVGGESGVGKSRLLQEVRTHALVNGFLVLTGQANENGDSFYELWRTPLRQLLLTLPHISDLDAGVLLPIIPDIADLLGREIPSAPPLDGEATQTRLFVTITQLLTETPQPVLLMLGDLHWATASLLPLPYLTRALTDTTDPSSLVVIGSYRDDERPELAQTLSDMQPLHLKRLTEDNMADLAAAMLGELGQRPDILQRLQQETEGNAFFAVEVLRTLAEDMGGLTHIGDAPLPDMLLPDGIQSIVQRRLARVPQEDQPLLQLAAVAGRTLDMSLLQTLNGGQAVTERWLHTCAEVAMIEVVDDSWQFQHAKMRDGLLAMMPTAAAKQHHQQVAEAIEQVYPDNPRYAAQLMVHWRQAEHPEKEFTYAYQAGSHAASQYANEDAIDYLTRAYELACNLGWKQDGQDGQGGQHVKRQYDVLLKREEIYMLLALQEQRQADLTVLTTLADALGQPVYQIEIALRQSANALVNADHDMARTFAEAAMTQAQLIDNEQLLLKAYRLLGQIWTSTNDYVQAKRFLSQAQSVAKERPPTLEIGKVFTMLGTIANEQSEFAQSLAYLKESLRISKALNDEQQQADTLALLGDIARKMAHYEDALAYFMESLEIFTRTGQKQGECQIANDLALFYYEMHDVDTALTFCQQALVTAQQLNYKWGLASVTNTMAMLTKRKGQIAEAYDYYRRALQLTTEIGQKRGQAAVLLNLGALWRNEKGAFEEAIDYYERSIAVSDSLGMIDLRATAESNLGLTFTRLGDYKRAQSYLARALASHRQTDVRSGEGIVLQQLGHLLMAQGNFDQAKQTIQAALAIHREVHDAEHVIVGLTQLAWLAYHDGDYEVMLAYYQEALAESRQHDHLLYGQMVGHVGVLWATFLLGHTDLEPDIHEVLVYLEQNQSFHADQGATFRLHLICYKFFQVTGHPIADNMLIFAHEHIQQIASYIETPEWRESFLTNVPEQRELEQHYRAFIHQS